MYDDILICGCSEGPILPLVELRNIVSDVCPKGNLISVINWGSGRPGTARGREIR